MNVESMDLPRVQTSDENKPQRCDLPYEIDTVAVSVGRRFQASPYREVQQLEYDLHYGTLRLFGRISSFYLKQIAQEAIRELPGVQRVLNQLEVVYSSEIPPWKGPRYGDRNELPPSDPSGPLTDRSGNCPIEGDIRWHGAEIPG